MPLALESLGPVDAGGLAQQWEGMAVPVGRVLSQGPQSSPQLMVTYLLTSVQCGFLKAESALKCGDKDWGAVQWGMLAQQT